MSSTGEEVEITSFFAGSLLRGLAIDKDVAASKLLPNFYFVPESNVVVSEGEKCVRRALEEGAASDGRAEEASEEDSFVDIMCSLERETGGESEGFTIANIPQRADLLVAFRQVLP